MCHFHGALSTEEVATKTPQKKALKRLEPKENIDAVDGEKNVVLVLDMFLKWNE